MHRDVEIFIECPITDVQRAKDFLILNKLVYVKDIVQTPTAAPETVLLSIPATVFDEPDVQILEQTLKVCKYRRSGSKAREDKDFHTNHNS